MPKLGLAALLALSSVSAHLGCDGYEHGKDLFKRVPEQDVYVQKLRERFGHAPARVLTDPEEVAQHRERSKRASTSYPAAVTQINSGAIAQLSSGTGTSEAVSALPTTFAPGTSSPIQGARALPAVTIIPSDWPPLDRPPPTDTPEVQQWLSEIDLSGVPNWAPYGIGGCQNTTYNAQAISQAKERGWWTCGGNERNTDITFCPNKNTWGLSYDDGPSPYTPKLMDYMAEADLHATIFTVGSRVISRPDILQYEYMAGHQIAVHTWSHFPLTTLTNEQIVAEIGWSKKAIYEVLGVTPKYMRWPYGDGDDRVRYIMQQMGMTNIIWTRYNGQTFDTRDWQIAGGVVNVSMVINNFDNILNQAPNMNTGFIVLEHDLYQQSTDLAVDYVLPRALANPALTLEPIINCLGMDIAQAYVETATNASSGLVPTTPIVGASGTALVANLTYTPEALGGDATGPVTTLGAPTTGSNSKPSNAVNAQSAAQLAAACSTSLLALVSVAALFITFA